MIVFYPHQRTADQEVLHLIFAIIKNLGSPVRMLSHSWICILIQACTIKLCKSMGIFWKMRRYPVQDHTDFILVALVDKICKVLRFSVAGSRCIISGHLISPGTIKRILRNTHQLNVCVPHFFYIWDQIGYEIPVTVKSFIIPARMTFPGARMNLVDCHRLCIHILFFFTILHPLAVCPFKMFNIRNRRCCSRPEFCIICIRICLIKTLAIFCLDQILI